MTRYFVALLPPSDVQAAINRFKQRFADRYHSRKAFNAPPHITLQPPFDWPLPSPGLPPEQHADSATLTELTQSFQALAATQPPIVIQLNGFGAFAPRVIYVNVFKTAELRSLQAEVTQYFVEEWSLTEPQAQSRPFIPHITVAFRDLTRSNFHMGWAEFKDKPFTATFTVTDLVLLVHNGRHWERCQTFPMLVREDVCKDSEALHLPPKSPNSGGL